MQATAPKFGWRIILFCLGLICCGFARAEWTGVMVDVYDGDADWQFANSVRRAQTGSIGFRIEEKTAGDLRVGVHLGYLSVRVTADTAVETRRYDAQNFGVYLYQPLSLTDSISLNGEIDVRYATGNDDSGEERAEIDWSEVSLDLGLAVRLGNLRLEPYAMYSDIDGDISDEFGTQVFELDDPVTTGIRLDYFIEQTGFLRLDFSSGGNQGLRLVFVRRY